MATNKLIHPPISASYLIPPIPRFRNLIKSHKSISTLHSNLQTTRFGEIPSRFNPISTIKVAEKSSELFGEDNQTEEISDSRSITQIKAELFQAIQGINRGIFGIQSAKKIEIEDLVKLLEIQNPTPNPTLELKKIGGCWKLVYSTITILGSKRTKLGLRDFISLGDFLQIIDVGEGKAVNVIKFNARGLNLFNGQLTIEASFKIASNSRVDINYENSSITPNQLMNLYRKNFNLLLGVFNPEGWLEITYVDDEMRMGRDDKGNIFILERFEETKP